MGNFSINHHSKIKVGQRSVEILYLVDMAEIPTFQEMRQFDITPKTDDPSVSRYLDRQEQLLKEGLSLASDGQFVRLDTHISPAGIYRRRRRSAYDENRVRVSGRSMSARAPQLSYLDSNFPGRAGWKEIVVAGDGVVILDSSAPSTDRSQELTTYSSDVLNGPPQQLSALIDYRTSLSAPEKCASAVAIGRAPARRSCAQRTLQIVLRRLKSRAGRRIQMLPRDETMRSPLLSAWHHRQSLRFHSRPTRRIRRAAALPS